MPDIKTRQELTEVARALRDRLEAGLSKEWNVLERPYPLALMFLADKRDLYDLRSHEFESMVGAYYGLAAEQWVAGYLELHAQLSAKGFVSTDSSFEFGNDAYVWAAADRTLPEKDLGISLSDLLGVDFVEEPRFRQAKAFVLETQSRNFLVVLNESYGRWTLHFREFWPDVRQGLAADRYLGALDGYKDRRDLTLMDVIVLASASQEYGDALPGVDYPKRPHLQTLLDGNLMAGDEEAGIGLRYGDARDKGYILSLRSSDDRPEVEHALQANYGDIAYVAYNLASARDVLSEEE